MIALTTRQPDAAARLLLTSKQAAEALAISQRMLWELTAPRGPLHAIRLPGRGIADRALRYPVQNLEKWIRETIEAQTEPAPAIGAAPPSQ